MTPLIPKYRCEQIASAVALTLGMAKPLHWTQVRAYYQPQLPGLESHILREYDPEMRQMIGRCLERERKHWHVYTP